MRDIPLNAILRLTADGSTVFSPFSFERYSGSTISLLLRERYVCNYSTKLSSLTYSPLLLRLQ